MIDEKIKNTMVTRMLGHIEKNVAILYVYGTRFTIPYVHGDHETDVERRAYLALRVAPLLFELDEVSEDDGAFVNLLTEKAVNAIVEFGKSSNVLKCSACDVPFAEDVEVFETSNDNEALCQECAIQCMNCDEYGSSGDVVQIDDVDYCPCCAEKVLDMCEENNHAN